MRSYLYCNVCGAENSTDAGDYFLAPDNQVFKCHGENMWLVERRGRFEGDAIREHTVTVGMLRRREREQREREAINA